jgi:hypothetical protein
MAEEKKDAKELYLFLKKRCHNCSGANVEIIIETETFKKTKTGYGEYNFNYEIYNRIDEFDENEFEIVALGHRLRIPYEKLKYWKPDEWENDKSNPNKIHLYLNTAIVLYEKEKIVLEDVKSEAQGRP